MHKKKSANFEKQMARLQAIVQELERPDIALERGVALYKEACMLAESCKGLLTRAKNEITVCGEDGNREFKFAAAASTDEGEDDL